jgi:hypothetical protein
MNLGLGEILKKASDQTTYTRRVKFLREHDSTALRTVLAFAYDSRYVWDFPDGWEPSYRPSEYLDQEGFLYQSLRFMKKFFVDGYPGLSPKRKAELFVDMLESVTPLDAELLIAMKNKKLPFPGLGKAVINEAFPGLIQDVEAN